MIVLYSLLKNTPECFYCNNYQRSYGKSMNFLFVKVLVIFLGLILSTQQVFSKSIYKCFSDGAVKYQDSPCMDFKKQEVACVNYGGGLDFEPTSEARCLKNKESERSRDGSSTKSYSSSANNAFTYLSPKIKSQRVSGYTRRDGTYVKPYNRSRRR